MMFMFSKFNNNVNQILTTVRNILAFHESDEGKEFISKCSDPYQYKHLAVHLPRRSGLTTAALALLDTYPNSAMIVPNNHMITMLYQRVLTEPNNFRNLYQEFQTRKMFRASKYLFSEQNLEDNWDQARRGVWNWKKKLIILDPSSMIERQRIARERHFGFVDFEQYLFDNCDLLIELG